ncbi:hypothetical protein [Cytobacillus gottheilii]|uniref:hypothetical protein n=1 Tax=Cytobacillus gottheilii TaxID=859144 RepID=UPI00249499DE|nr:hypothetical protein [Cytobacillus gottheilii]
MKKWIIIICLGALFLATIFAWIIEKKDERALKVLEAQLHTFEWFNEQIQLTNEVILSFSNNEASIETVDVSVNSLRNTYRLFLTSMYSLELVETERFHMIQDLWDTYWKYTSFTDPLSKQHLALLQEQGNEFTKVEKKISNEVNELKRKQRNYWWH